MNIVSVELLPPGPSMWTCVWFTVLVLGAGSDLRCAKIPNWLTYSAMGGGLLFHTTQEGLSGLSQSVGGLLIGIALFLAFYLLGGMGAGDVKFMGAVGSMVGLSGILPAAGVTTLLGGAYAVATAIRHWGIGTGAWRILSPFLAWALTGRLALAPPDTQPKLRYGVVIAAGTVVAQWWTGHL